MRRVSGSEGGGFICINTVSSQCRLSFQAFVAAPTMKCVCPPKAYTHSGFPHLREEEEEEQEQEEKVAGASLSGVRARQQEENKAYSARCTQRGPGTGCCVSLATPLSSTLRHAQLHSHTKAPFVSFHILAFSLSPIN